MRTQKPRSPPDSPHLSPERLFREKWPWRPWPICQRRLCPLIKSDLEGKGPGGYRASWVRRKNFSCLCESWGSLLSARSVFLKRKESPPYRQANLDRLNGVGGARRANLHCLPQGEAGEGFWWGGCVCFLLVSSGPQCHGSLSCFPVSSPLVLLTCFRFHLHQCYSLQHCFPGVPTPASFHSCVLPDISQAPQNRSCLLTELCSPPKYTLHLDGLICQWGRDLPPIQSPRSLIRPPQLLNY